MSKKEICMDARAVAYFSGFGGIEIYHIEYGINDFVYFAAGCWNGKKTLHKAMIYYGKNDSFFKYNGVRIHFGECLRTDI